MIISVINHTNGKVSDEELQNAIRAINRQIREDYEPYWHIGGELRLEGRSGKKPSVQNIADMRGDAVLYLWDAADVDNALGYHDLNNRGVPYGFVFTELAKQLKEEWTVTLSHEALELVGDSEVNLLVQGPHPSDSRRTVFHWYEMCDAVQAETYEIDKVKVSNFVLPLYFTGGEEKGGRNDFLGRTYRGKTLQSFGVNPGGYVGFFNPQSGEHETYTAKGDRIAAKRLKVKSKMKGARRGIRYQRYMK
ncbi:MAG: hypothetical protein OEY86_17610 [Nitrospira sp.]|nr:hypothetical protein [Nitrospira sp.]